jgi:hypothetical protein
VPAVQAWRIRSILVPKGSKLRASVGADGSPVYKLLLARDHLQNIQDGIRHVGAEGETSRVAIRETMDALLLGEELALEISDLQLPTVVAGADGKERRKVAALFRKIHRLQLSIHHEIRLAIFKCRRRQLELERAKLGVNMENGLTVRQRNMAFEAAVRRWEKQDAACQGSTDAVVRNSKAQQYTKFAESMSPTSTQAQTLVERECPTEPWDDMNNRWKALRCAEIKRELTALDAAIQAEIAEVRNWPVSAHRGELSQIESHQVMLNRILESNKGYFQNL